MKFNTELPVQFRDLDCLGHVNSAVYLQYMETTRIEFMRATGRISEGFRPGFIIASCHCEYRKPITDERRIVVSLWSSKIRGRSWDFDYEVANETHGLFAKGRTTQVAYDYRSTSPVTIPVELVKLLAKYGEKPLKFREAGD